MHEPPDQHATTLFVAVEGPTGVGTTTVTRLLAERLARFAAVPVHSTAEPTDTPLGRLLRCEQWTLTSRALALAIAADRYAHIDNEIIPQLNAGFHVITDRYVQSSLVRQRLDGLPIDEVWRYNTYVLPPAVSFYLVDDPRVIDGRLAARSGRARWDLTCRPSRQLRLYDEARGFLHGEGWRQVVVDCRRHDQAAVADIAMGHLARLITPAGAVQ